MAGDDREPIGRKGRPSRPTKQKVTRRRVREEDYEKMLEFDAAGKPYQLAFIDEKSKETPETGLVCREWLGYLNLNLTMLISRLEALKEEWRIKSDDEVRIVFWFDN